MSSFMRPAAEPAPTRTQLLILDELLEGPAIILPGYRETKPFTSGPKSQRYIATNRRTYTLLLRRRLITVLQGKGEAELTEYARDVLARRESARNRKAIG